MRPRPGVLNPLDLPNDFFRIHLVSALLDTCGQCFDRGSSKKKLDQFLAFFQVSRSQAGINYSIIFIRRRKFRWMSSLRFRICSRS